MSTPPSELQEKLPHDPRLWVRNYLRHPNDPSRKYDFYDDNQDNFLWYLVDDEGPMNPEQWGDINILLFARGCLKTWSCTSIMGWGVDMYPMEVTATAPVDDQRGEVLDVFQKKVEDSELINRRVKDNVSHQKFKATMQDPRTGETYTAYSAVKSRSAWGDGDKLRGLHSQMGVLDESQDIDEGAFSTFLEVVDQSIPRVEYFPTTFIIGTPKMANSFFHKLWKMSDQKSWDADTREWQTQSEPQEFLPEDLKEEQAELQDKISQLDEDENEQLINELQDQLDEIEGFTVRGWHIDQHNSPLHSASDIAFKKETYSPKKFKNEVEAKFYTPENDLLTTADVKSVLDHSTERQTSRLLEDSRVIMGVDWGGGSGEGAARSAYVVAEFHEDHFDVLTYDTLDSSLTKAEEVREIEQLHRTYDVDITVVDEGFGDANRSNLQDGVGTEDDSGYDNIFGCRYGNVKSKDELTWNRFENQKRFFTVNRTYMIEKFVEDMKAGNYTIPASGISFDSKHDLGTQLVDELTAPYTDRVETSGGRRKLKVLSDRNDDLFHAFVFAWIAAKKVEVSKRTLKKIGSNMRDGYE